MVRLTYLSSIPLAALANIHYTYAHARRTDKPRHFQRRHLSSTPTPCPDILPTLHPRQIQSSIPSAIGTLSLTPTPTTPNPPPATFTPAAESHTPSLMKRDQIIAIVATLVLVLVFASAYFYKKWKVYRSKREMDEKIAAIQDQHSDRISLAPTVASTIDTKDRDLEHGVGGSGYSTPVKEKNSRMAGSTLYEYNLARVGPKAGLSDSPPDPYGTADGGTNWGAIARKASEKNRKPGDEEVVWGKQWVLPKRQTGLRMTGGGDEDGIPDTAGAGGSGKGWQSAMGRISEEDERGSKASSVVADSEDEFPSNEVRKSRIGVAMGGDEPSPRSVTWAAGTLGGTDEPVAKEADQSSKKSTRIGLSGVLGFGPPRNSGSTGGQTPSVRTSTLLTGSPGPSSAKLKPWRKPTAYPGK